MSKNISKTIIENDLTIDFGEAHVLKHCGEQRFVYLKGGALSDPVGYIITVANLRKINTAIDEAIAEANKPAPTHYPSKLEWYFGTYRWCLREVKTDRVEHVADSGATLSDFLAEFRHNTAYVIEDAVR